MEAWQENIIKLEAYYQANGHWQVSLAEDVELAQWIQQASATQLALPLLVYERLLSMGFTFHWSPGWQQQYEQLRGFAKQFGHVYVPGLVAGYGELFGWMERQRQVKSKLSRLQVSLLDQLGFYWSPLTSREARWEFMFEQLRAFQAQHGHLQVTSADPDEYGLAYWVANQRARDHRLSPEQKARLSALGFLWKGQYAEQQETTWQQRYEQLREFGQQYGHVQVPIKWKPNRKLATWISEQRLRHKHGKLSEERKHQLDQLGFVWSEGVVAREEAHWQAMYGQLLAFKQQYGHVQVAATSQSHQPLAHWVQAQRQMHRQGKLSTEKYQQLTAIGFAWANTIHPRQWEKMYSQLIAYSQEHGHSNVPQQCEQNRSLGAWVNAQRQKYQQGKLSPEQIKQLDQLGFCWQAASAEEQWQVQCQALQDYYRQQGHVNVTAQAAPPLYRWIIKQRQAYKKGRLAPWQVEWLSRLGFQWSEDLQQTRKQHWQQLYGQLVQFKQQHGHWKVPEASHPILARWMAKQRQRYKRGQLLEAYKQQLESINFPWHVYRTGKVG